MIERRHLSKDEAEGAMREIMSGSATPAQIAAFLVALRMKGESIEEVASFAKVMREFAITIEPKHSGRLLDTCGTGGDGGKTCNISTLAALVACSAGATVAKHGNRSVSGLCGSADVLEELGVKIDAEPELVKRCIEEVGMGLLYAPRFHPAMRFAAPVRREMGIRTIFNILGPLTNPAKAEAQLLGVYDPNLLRPLGEVLLKLGCLEALLVHSEDGLDELSIASPSRVVWVRGGRLEEMKLEPEDFGLSKSSLQGVIVRSREEAVSTFLRVLRGEGGAASAMVRMNAAAALVVAGVERNFKEAALRAEEVLKGGRAYEKLRELVRCTGGSIAKLEEVERRLDLSG